MLNQNVKYAPIKADDIALIRWSKNSYKGTPIYIGLVNDFIVVVCTQTSGIEYDSVVIRFRLRNYECKSCEIDSLTGNRMCPCPRGSCDAVVVGKLQTIRTYERTAPYGDESK